MHVYAKFIFVYTPMHNSYLTVCDVKFCTVYIIYIDIDECDRGIDECDNGTTECDDTIGSYQCLCLPGFIGNMDETSCDGM